MVRYRTLPYRTVRYGMVPYSTILVRYNTEPYGRTVPYGTVVTRRNQEAGCRYHCDDPCAFLSRPPATHNLCVPSASISWPACRGKESRIAARRQSIGSVSPGLVSASEVNENQTRLKAVQRWPSWPLLPSRVAFPRGAVRFGKGNCVYLMSPNILVDAAVLSVLVDSLPDLARQY
jgi:hypothetical protein